MHEAKRRWLPTSPIAETIDVHLGGYEAFAEAFKGAGATQFGNGWAWLALEDDKLRIVKTHTADRPIAHVLKPILTADVWEHAY